jgi:hypothetical protein
MGVSSSLRSVAWVSVEIWGKERGRELEFVGGANVDNINLMEKSMKLVNPVREVFFVISVFIISNLPGPC